MCLGEIIFLRTLMFKIIKDKSFAFQPSITTSAIAIALTCDNET